MTSRINRLTTAARVYLKNGPTVYLAKPYVHLQTPVPERTALAEQIGSVLDTPQGVIDAINTDGDRVQIPAGEVLDVVYPQESKVAVPAGVFWGKRLQVRNLHDYTKEAHPTGITLAGFDLQGDPEDYTVLTGEDLGEAEIAVVNVATGHVAWLNPAVPTEANDLAVQATLMLARMEELTNLAYHDNATALEDPDLGVQDIENAQAQYKAGNVRAAINIAGAHLVTEWIAQDASGPDMCVRFVAQGTNDTAGFGVVGSYNPDRQQFGIDLFDASPTLMRAVENIEEVVSFSWEDYQRTGDTEQFLTEAGRRHISELPVPAN